MKSLSRGRRDYGTVPTALPLMPPSGTLIRRRQRVDRSSSSSASFPASFPSPSAAYSRARASAFDIPRFYHIELRTAALRTAATAATISSRSKIISVPPTMDFSEFLRGLSRVLQIDPTTMLQVCFNGTSISTLPALHSVPSGSLLQIEIMPDLQPHRQRQQQEDQIQMIPLPAFVQLIHTSAPKGSRPVIVELNAASTWSAIVTSFKAAVGADERNKCNLSLQNNIPIHSLSDLAKLEGGAILLLHEIKRNVIDDAYRDLSKPASATELLETLGNDAMAAVTLLTSSALDTRRSQSASSGSSNTEASPQSSDMSNMSSLSLTATTIPATSDKFLTRMPWKRLHVVYILAPPGAEEVSLAHELAIRRGYTPIVLEDIVAAEIEEGTPIGRDILNEFSAGHNGLTPNVAAILIQKAIANAAGELVKKLAAESPDETPLAQFMAKEARERATATAAAQSGLSVHSVDNAKIFHAALQQRYLLVGFPPSVQHDIVLSNMVAPCRQALFLEMNEGECVRALLDTLDVPLRDNTGAITSENRGGYAGHRRKLEVQRRVRRKMAAQLPVLHHLATQGKLRRLEFSQDGSVLKKSAIRRIMPVDPCIYREASRLLSPVPAATNGDGMFSRRTVRPQLATSRALVMSAPNSGQRHRQREQGSHVLVPYSDGSSSSSPRRSQSGNGLSTGSSALVPYSPVRPGSHTAGLQQPSPRTLELVRRAKHVARKNAFKYIGPPASSAEAFSGAQHSGSRVVISKPLERATLLSDVAAGTVKLSEATTSPQRLHSDVDDAKRRKERLNRTVEDEVVLLLLAWLRSLQLESCYDLTHTTDNWRRDFANGWVISLLLRRYFPTKFPNEAVFINGSSTKIKRQNWLHIVNFLRSQVGLTVPMDMVSRVMLAKKDAVRPLLLLLHQSLELSPHNGRARKNLPPRTIGALS